MAIRQPLRVVVDIDGAYPRGAGSSTAPRDLDRHKPQRLAPTRRRVALPALLAALHGRGVRAVLVEGGPRLAAPPRRRMVDKIVGYVAHAPARRGPTALVDAGVTTIAEAIDGTCSTLRRSVRTCGSPALPEEGC